jgi:hypothetical protein
MLALLVSGCGLFSSDDDDDSSTSTTSGAAPSGPDDGAAGNAMLTVEDFPSGWGAENVNPNLANAIVGSVPECAALAEALQGGREEQSGSAGPVTFSSGDERVDASVQVFPDAAAAEGLVTAIRESDPAPCETSIIVAARDVFNLSDGPVESTFQADAGLGDSSTSVITTGASDAGTTTITQTWIQSGRSVVTMLTVVPPPGSFVPTNYIELLLGRIDEEIS